MTLGDTATDPARGARDSMETPVRARSTRPRAMLAVVGAGVLGVLLLGPAAALAASRLPSPLTASTLEVPEVDLEKVTRVRDVPVGLAPGTVVGSVEELRPHAVDAVGAPVARSLLALLTERDENGVLATPVAATEVGTTYPYRFPVVEDLLRDVPPDQLERGGTALGAALTLLAADPRTGDDVRDTAARIAFTVLDRARSAGGCDAQLDLFTLMAADLDAVSDDVDREATEARRACPDDPTAWWLVAQRAINEVPAEPDGIVPEDFELANVREAQDRATEFVRAFPRDPVALATLADSYVATGRFLTLSQPFTARRAYLDAAAAYARLPRSDAGALVGAARAALGAGDPARAAELAERAADGSARPARALQVAVAAQEGAHHYDLAAAAAKHLADLGSGAFPTAAALYPFGEPLSVGADRLSPLTVALLGLGQGGGGLVVDLGFIPAYREDEGLTDSEPDCPQWVWRRDLLLAGDPAGAVADWPGFFEPTDPVSFPGSCPDAEPLKRQADSLRSGELAEDVESEEVKAELEPLLDSRQNLYRWAGDLPEARRQAARWAAHFGDQTSLAHQRLGEIDYLMGDYDSAATEFATAALRSRTLTPTDDLSVQRAHLGQGAALMRADRAAEAVEVLQPLVLDGAEGYGYLSAANDSTTAEAFAIVSYYASTLLGDHELAVGHPDAAATNFDAALLWSDTLDDEVHLDATRNSAAVAAVGAGDIDRSIALSRAAVEADPLSPVYLMTSADVALRAGDVPNAVRQNRAALASDPTDYPAANNLGVLLARRGHLEQASRVLRGAVAAEPGYALGWHNLGVVEGRRGPLHVLPSQGALARSVTLDSTYADAPSNLALDTATYRTGLDVSKPIPGGWSFAGSQRTAPVLTVGLLALTLAGVGLVSLRDTSPSQGAAQWLEGIGERLGRARGIRRLRRPVWAVLATVAAFLLAFWRQPLWPWTGITYAAGLLVLIGAGMLVRLVVARRSTSGVVHGTWVPSVLVGLVAGAFGSPVAPMPVVRAPARSARVAMAAPLTLAMLSLLLLLEAALLHTPLTTSFCVAAFVMSGSLLLPVGPLDGSRAGRAGVVGAAGLLGAVLLLGLGLV